MPTKKATTKNRRSTTAETLGAMTPSKANVLTGLEKVMTGTSEPQAFSDVLRRLTARRVRADASLIVDSIRTDTEGRAAAGQGPRFVVTADKRLRWVGDTTPPATPEARKPARARKTATRSPGKAKLVAEATEATEPAASTVELPRKVAAARRTLLRQLLKLTPTEFEKLCARVMTAMGVQDVEATPPTNDAGVDVRGVLVIEDLIRIRVAVQVKRYKGNVTRPEVQKLRGSLSHGEVGWFMTTGDYSPGAREEATNSTRQPISLLNGLEVADLVLKYSVPLADEEPQR